MPSRIWLSKTLEHTGQLILFMVFIVCMFDLYGFTDRGQLLVPLSGYLTAICSGVALHIVASPIKHMDFAKDNDGKNSLIKTK